MRIKHLCAASLLILLSTMSGLASVASAQVECDFGGITLFNNVQFHSLTDYGVAAAWFRRDMPGRDLFSGENAHNLRFSVDGTVVSGTGWLSPCLLRSLPGSPWVVTTPIHYSSPDPSDLSQAQSAIRHPMYGIDITITTQLVGNSVMLTFAIVNNGTDVIQAIRLADYFNFHPNGSSGEDPLKGTIRYEGVDGLLTSGTMDATFVANGRLLGSMTDVAHDVGSASPNDTIRRVENNAYNNGTTFGPGDAAGALAYDLPDLDPGTSIIFQLTMSLVYQ